MPNSFFFPCLRLIPEGDLVIETAKAALHPRKWETSTFDFATLGARHKLHLSWQMLEVLTADCNLEIEIRGTEDLAEAQRRASLLQAMMYLNGVDPFVMPVAMTNSILDYSGINFRDSDTLRSKLPEGLRSGFCSADGKIEGWLHEANLQIITSSEKRLSSEAFRKSVTDAEAWEVLEERHEALQVARIALQTAPMISNVPSSLLHLWQGIEALFPEVQAEVSFRLSLYVSQLCAPISKNRVETYRAAKKSYGQRSSAAHGRGKRVDIAAWVDARRLLIECLRACLERAELPTELSLTEELLA